MIGLFFATMIGILAGLGLGIFFDRILGITNVSTIAVIIMFLWIISYFIYALSNQPEKKKRKVKTSREICFDNMKLLHKAVKKYNTERTYKLRDLNLDLLIKRNYLEKSPACPAGGEYGGSELDNESGLISCSKHVNLVVEVEQV
ncbi:hypothetical protein ACFL35_01770 [Candidatus Riflebacteria bacterium]